MRRGLLFPALLLLAGCTFPSVPAGTQAPAPATSTPATSTPAGSATPTGAGSVTVSPVEGTAIDRPTPAPVQVTPKGYADAPTGTGLSGYLDQRLRWSNCGGTAVCADVVAPLDYADPGAQALTLSLKKLPATAAPRLGTLFINPGGPGGSGKELVDSFSRTGLEQYDIVGWDPRGTGDSTPVRCYDSARADAMNDLDASPDTEQERTALLQATAEFADSCWEHSGDLLNHISTIETVRDLDLLRRLVDDDSLHFLGYSYGTQIGATYAELFPDKVGRVVLDAAVNISEDDAVIQAMGFDLALGNFAQWCGEEACVLGGSKDEVLATITGLWDDLESAPLAVGDRRLTQSYAVRGVATLLYSGKAAWPALVAYVQKALQHEGRPLLWAADQLNDRGDGGTYGTMFYAFPAISCLDDTTDRGVLAADKAWVEDQQKAPIFGRYFGPDYGCALWPVRPAPALDIRGAGAAPIVVVGGTGDNATPYQQAVEMADQLESAVLVTYQGEGHGSFGGKSSCVDALVVAYLVKGTVPQDGVRCS